MPGFISAVGSGVENAPSVGVAVAGNHIMVPVGTAVFEGRGVTVGTVAANGRQAVAVIVRRSTATKPSPNK
jgi:hypothetical protein